MLARGVPENVSQLCVSVLWVIKEFTSMSKLLVFLWLKEGLALDRDWNLGDREHDRLSQNISWLPRLRIIVLIECSHFYNLIWIGG